jgi:hypothetical protein
MAQSEDQSKLRVDTLKCWASLEQERQSWTPTWRDLAEYILPYRMKYLADDTTKGVRKDGAIINSAGTRAVGILAAGIMSAMTSQGRKWFRLSMENEDASIRLWLDDCERRVLERMGKTDLYLSLQTLYPDFAVFGQSPMLIEDDVKQVVRTRVLPIGTYAIATNAENEVDTLFRKTIMTAKQMVEKFGTAVSSTVRTAYDGGNYYQPFTVIHAIQPNPQFDPRRADGMAKRFRSLWLEQACDDKNGFLRQGGYNEFPAAVPRWETTAEEAYGIGRGWHTIGDIRALQHGELRKADALDKVVDPPMVGPASLDASRVNLMPGGLTYVDLLGPGSKFQAAFETNPNAVREARESNMEIVQRIKEGWFVDLWLMLANTDKEMTAEEVRERMGEKMMQLGPVATRLDRELLKPIVTRFFNTMLRAGLLPPPPKPVRGADIRVEFTSVLSQAQHLEEAQKLDAFLTGVGRMAATSPTVLDKVDTDAVVDGYAKAYGVDGKVLREPEAVAQLRAARAQQQQQEAALQQSAAFAKGAETLSRASLEGNTVLSNLTGGVPGAGNGGAPQ